jgi:hypothetical protein
MRSSRRELDVTDEIDGRYAAEARALLAAYGVRVCHWRRAMTGLAWLGHPHRPIEAPHPRTPLSFAVLAHEVGHHALGRLRPRWREEQRAWLFALAQMHRLGVPVTAAVEQRYANSMRYALAKAMRRGLKEIPVELTPFLADDHQLIVRPQP